jgi:hypothetical protein
LIPAPKKTKKKKRKYKYFDNLYSNPLLEPASLLLKCGSSQVGKGKILYTFNEIIHSI